MNLFLGDTKLILAECERQGLTRNQAAYVLATAYHETAHTMKPVEEAFYLSNKVKDLDAWRKKNLRYYPWHGRGYVQLTWEKNYKRAQDETGIPFSESPELALQSAPAAVVLVKGMLNGWFTGKKLGSYVNVNKSDFYNARRIVNGLDKADTIAQLAKAYDEDLAKDGYGKGEDIPVPGAKPQVLKNLYKSKEMLAGGTAVASSAAGFLSVLTPTSQAILVAALSVALLAFGAFVVWNRLKARKDGER